MTRTWWLAGVGFICQAVCFGQTTDPRANSFLPQGQQGYLLPGGRGGGAVAIPPLRADTGKPFSATVTTQTSQTLSDGIHVSNTTTVLEYRDAGGRTRIETTEPSGPGAAPMKTIVIRDPVSGVTYRLDPARKTTAVMPRVSVAPGVVFDGFGEIPVSQGGGSHFDDVQAALRHLQEAMDALSNRNQTVEDLGTKTMNGVAAQGKRTTLVVPVGAVGNDREFRSVTEQWFCPDLNLLLKSVSSDPRFGATTYELTNISRQPPDPALFRPPADYTVVSPTQGGRGGRGNE